MGIDYKDHYINRIEEENRKLKLEIARLELELENLLRGKVHSRALPPAGRGGTV